MFSDAKEALKYISDNDIQTVDLKIAGLCGQWMHITIPASNFTQKYFELGVGYDGSSGSGFSSVESGDVVAIPDPETAFIDPFWENPTLSFICDTVTADTREPFGIDPRTIARRAENYLKSTGIADTALFGPEMEFHIFDSVNVVTDQYYHSLEIRACEYDPEGQVAAIPAKQGYLRIPPSDQTYILREAAVAELTRMNIPVRYHHHEVGAPGQCEIEIDLAPLVQVADRVMMIKYVIKNVARQFGKIATFMPKPIYGEAGNGMHVHQKLQKGDEHLFYDADDSRYANLSDLALHYIGGLLRHGPALTGLTNPSTNSFKRLVEGYEAPVNLFFSLANRSAAIRVPRYATTPSEKRIEYRPPDFTSNIYLCLAAMLMAGLDGIDKKINPRENNMGPYDVDIARTDEEFRQQIVPLPKKLSGALDALEADKDFLSVGEVFPKDFVKGWVTTKSENDVRPVTTRPHQHEYTLYLDT